MREILFRGKTAKQNNGVTTEKPIKENMWVYGNLTVGKLENYHIDMISNKKEIYTIKSETIGQFTGLTDKNGKEIFEGDIVNGLFLHGSAILGVVAFQDGAFGLAWKRGKIDEFSPFPCMCNVNYEIVGNIHDNPELLGE